MATAHIGQHEGILCALLQVHGGRAQDGARCAFNGSQRQGEGRLGSVRAPAVGIPKLLESWIAIILYVAAAQPNAWLKLKKQHKPGGGLPLVCVPRLLH